MERKRLRGGVMNIDHYVDANLNFATTRLYFLCHKVNTLFKWNYYLKKSNSFKKKCYVLKKKYELYNILVIPSGKG